MSENFSPAGVGPEREDARGWGRPLVWFCVLGGLVCFFRLGSAEVVSMEGIVADGARQMDRSGDYVVPRLYGEVYAYKPPLAYWLAFASFKLWGCETEWSLRFPMALSVFLAGAALLLIVGRLLDPRTGGLCALATLTSVLMIQKARMAEFDAPLAAGVGVAMAVACANLAAPRPRAALWLIGYAGLAFGFLAKGLPAPALYGPGLLIAALSTRTVRRLAAPAHLLALLLFVVPAGIWIWYAHRQIGGQLFEHAFADVRSRGTEWTWRSFGLTLAKPAIVAVLFLPWSLLLPRACSRRWRTTQDDVTRRLATAAGAFLATGVALFMLVPAQSSRYYLPLAVPVGILAGLAAARRDGSQRAKEEPCGRSIAALRRLGWRWPVVPLLLAALTFWFVDVLVIQPRRAEARSLRAVAATFEPHLPRNAVVWTDSGDSFSSLFFYLRRPVRSFSVESGRPPDGSNVVAEARQLPALQSRDDVQCVIRSRAENGNQGFVLLQIHSP